MSAISATFLNFGKPNLQRKTFSFMMEVPIEQTQAVVNFFGSPTAEGADWFGIARMQEVEPEYSEPDTNNESI